MNLNDRLKELVDPKTQLPMMNKEQWISMHRDFTQDEIREGIALSLIHI